MTDSFNDLIDMCILAIYPILGVIGFVWLVGWLLMKLLAWIF